MKNLTRKLEGRSNAELCYKTVIFTKEKLAVKFALALRGFKHFLPKV